jgi:hypothetical protein
MKLIYNVQAPTEESYDVDNKNQIYRIMQTA